MKPVILGLDEKVAKGRKGQWKQKNQRCRNLDAPNFKAERSHIQFMDKQQRHDDIERENHAGIGQRLENPDGYRDKSSRQKNLQADRYAPAEKKRYRHNGQQLN